MGFAVGGQTAGRYNVEGGEVIEGHGVKLARRPRRVASNLVRVQGPKHGAGGVNGTGGERVYSDQLEVGEAFWGELDGLLSDDAPRFSSGGTLPGKGGVEAVRQQQRELNAKGAKLKVDGVWGPLSKAAHSKFSANEPDPWASRGQPLPLKDQVMNWITDKFATRPDKAETSPVSKPTGPVAVAASEKKPLVPPKAPLAQPDATRTIQPLPNPALNQPVAVLRRGQDRRGSKLNSNWLRRQQSDAIEAFADHVTSEETRKAPIQKLEPGLEQILREVAFKKLDGKSDGERVKIGYQDYRKDYNPTASSDKSGMEDKVGKFFRDDWNVANLLGEATIERNGNDLIVRDNYDFNNPAFADNVPNYKRIAPAMLNNKPNPGVVAADKKNKTKNAKTAKQIAENYFGRKQGAPVEIIIRDVFGQTPTRLSTGQVFTAPWGQETINKLGRGNSGQR